jgi:hypothetical protein
MSRLASQVSWAAGDLALDPADMVEIGDHAVADIADAGRQQGQAPRRHIDDLAGVFAPVGQHVAAEQVHLHPLEASPLLGCRKRRFLLRKRHHGHPAPDFGASSTLRRTGLTRR